MRRSNLIKVISILVISLMVMLFSTSVMAAETDNGFTDLTPRVDNNTTNGTSNANSNTANTNTNNTNTNNTNTNNTNTNTNSTNTDNSTNTNNTNTNTGNNNSSSSGTTNNGTNNNQNNYASTSNSSRLPYAGTRNVIIIAIAIFGIIAVFSFVKYRKYNKIK